MRSDLQFPAVFDGDRYTLAARSRCQHVIGVRWSAIALRQHAAPLISGMPVYARYPVRPLADKFCAHVVLLLLQVGRST